MKIYCGIIFFFFGGGIFMDFLGNPLQKELFIL